MTSLVVPSPKFHSIPEIVPLERLVNCIVNGLFSVGLAVNQQWVFGMVVNEISLPIAVPIIVCAYPAIIGRQETALDIAVTLVALFPLYGEER